MKNACSAKLCPSMSLRKMNLLAGIFSIWLLAAGLSGCNSGDSGSPAPVLPPKPVVVTIGPPQQIIADPGKARVTVSWTPVAEAVSYNIYYSTASGVNKTIFDTAVRDIHDGHIVRNLQNGTQYYFVVTAVGASGAESNISKEVSATPLATPPPVAPTNVTATTTGPGTIRLTWSASAEATSYTIYYDTVPNIKAATAAFSLINAVSPQDIAALINNTTYYFVVTAGNANGESVASFEVSCVPQISPPPTAPANLSAVEGNGAAALSWNAVAGAVSYNIYYATELFVSKTYGTKVTYTPPAPQPPTIVNPVAPLSNKTAYFFVVTAVNGNGESAESSVVSATPIAGPAPVNAMVRIAAGPFQMGDNLDGVSYALPVHTITISEFYIDRYETMYSLWKEVYDWAVDPARGAKVYTLDSPGRNGSQDMGTNMPVSMTSWYDAVKWLNARSEKEGKTPVYYTDAAQTTVYRTGRVDLADNMVRWNANGYRLPTEAEWEKAARGGVDGLRYPWGNDVSADKANYNMGRAVSAGLYPANAYGLYDMAGNVFEWTWDWGNEENNAYANWAAWGATDPRGPASSAKSTRIRRGGGYTYGSRYLACYERMFRVPTYTAPYFGFRSVRSVNN